MEWATIGDIVQSPFLPFIKVTAAVISLRKSLDEFRDMVKALHRAGIEVILDVVYNHTGEGGDGGPTYSFRGIDNSIYYLLEKDKSIYSNYSGCGNTLNANQPIVRRMIIDSLHFWVKHMHVDGFRFDLASILTRDEKGKPIENPPDTLGHRIRSGACRNQTDCGSMGCSGALSGWLIYWRQLERMEWKIPGRCKKFFERR